MTADPRPTTEAGRALLEWSALHHGTCGYILSLGSVRCTCDGLTAIRAIEQDAAARAEPPLTVARLAKALCADVAYHDQVWIRRGIDSCHTHVQKAERILAALKEVE